MTTLPSLPILQTSGELTLLSALSAASVVALVIAFRSASVVALAFAWLRLSAFARRRRVFRLPYATGQILAELRAAVPVIVLDALVVTAVAAFGWLPVGASTISSSLLTFGLMFAWFEIWFYATHRLMHTPRFYWIHRQHHTAKVVDPLSSLSFSLLERMILITGALGFAVVLAQLMTVSAPGLIAYGIVNYLLNVLGHSNVEVFPAWFTRTHLGKWIVTPTYHALHHARYRGHYGLFTAILDRAYGNVFPDYETVQELASGGKGLIRQGEKASKPASARIAEA